MWIVFWLAPVFPDHVAMESGEGSKHNLPQGTFWRISLIVGPLKVGKGRALIQTSFLFRNRKLQRLIQLNLHAPLSLMSQSATDPIWACLRIPGVNVLASLQTKNLVLKRGYPKKPVTFKNGVPSNQDTPENGIHFPSNRPQEVKTLPNSFSGSMENIDSAPATRKKHSH